MLSGDFLVCHHIRLLVFFNSAPTKPMRGHDEAVCTYQFPPFMPDKNKHVGSDQTYSCLHNNFIHLRYLVAVDLIKERSTQFVARWRRTEGSEGLDKGLVWSMAGYKKMEAHLSKSIWHIVN